MEPPELIAHLSAALGPRPPARLGVAVSGGGDSVGLLCALDAWAQDQPTELSVISIDHGLRPAARDELRFVRDLCARLGVDHHIEYWSNWDGAGNLQSAARAARFALIADWAAGNEIDHVALGHTANDQAETLLMRLARGSGVDGLSGMAPQRRQNGVTWLRPLLGVLRRDLRAFLRARGETWSEDPSNEDTAFERVRMRDAMPLLEPLGLTAEGLAQVAANMQMARAALDVQTHAAGREIAVVDVGAVRVSYPGFAALPAEIARRLVVRAIMWLGGHVYSPRRASVDTLLAAIAEGRTSTLEGVQVQRSGGELWLYREYEAVRDLTAAADEAWDERWSLSDIADEDTPFELRALGPDGLQASPGWRDLGVPRAALLSVPGLWDGDRLVASPLSPSPDVQAEFDDAPDSFYAALLSH
ncbi:MAG: tRNA lysidine(34) synthetase TilS [Pseudomonadota bacterium]